MRLFKCGAALLLCAVPLCNASVLESKEARIETVARLLDIKFTAVDDSFECMWLIAKNSLRYIKRHGRRQDFAGLVDYLEKLPASSKRGNAALAFGAIYSFNGFNIYPSGRTYAQSQCTHIRCQPETLFTIIQHAMTAEGLCINGNLDSGMVLDYNLLLEEFVNGNI